MADKKPANRQRVAKKTSTGKPTQKQLAKKWEVSERTISRWKASGVDIYNDDEVRIHVSNLERQPDSAKRKLIDIPGETDAEKIKHCETLEELKFIKTLIDSKKAAHALEVELGNYTKNSEIKESFIRIFSVFKAGLFKYESEMPNKIQGMDAAEIQKTISEANQNLLNEFQELANEIM